MHAMETCANAAQNAEETDIQREGGRERIQYVLEREDFEQRLLRVQPRIFHFSLDLTSLIKSR